MATSALPTQSTLMPAQLGFLAVFNPSLGATDETLDDQIVYYTSLSPPSPKRRHRSRGKSTADISQEERNERLRQIGLAQGMVEFSRDFSNGAPVDHIETEKTRVVLHEVEPGWWILASIDLTRIPLPPRLGAQVAGKPEELPENVEYSSRELRPAMLLTRDLLRAHSIFLLHHAPSLSALFVKTGRTNFVRILGRYWDMFTSTWDVMLHGNPASTIFGGIKMAACGELGVGVGEEDRGSSEREVFEGFVDRVEGLVDLVVSRFDPLSSTSGTPTNAGVAGSDSPSSWLGTGEAPKAEDGPVFLGVGAISRKSLRDITWWMEDIYTWGENAYGVKDRPTPMGQTRRRNRSAKSNVHNELPQQDAESKNSNIMGASPGTEMPAQSTPVENQTEHDEARTRNWMEHLKMGYGTHWTLGSHGTEENTSNPDKSGPQQGRRLSDQSLSPSSESTGQYLIGLLGDMEQSLDDEEEQSSRIPLRTLTVELNNVDPMDFLQVQDLGSQSKELTLTQSGSKDSMDPNSQFNSQDRNKSRKMRVVVYVNKPFIFTFLFKNGTDSLAWDVLYRSLHHQLSPLRKSLVASTNYRPGRPDIGEAASHIYDLVWDPKAMTIHSTIPNIPMPLEMFNESVPQPWSRAEAVNTHNQILNTYASTLSDYSELERTCKTSRGWWVVWTRILERDPVPSATVPKPGTPTETNEDNNISSKTSSNSSATPQARPQPPALLRHESSEGSGQSGYSGGPGTTSLPPKPKVAKEIFLIRRAGEHSSSSAGSALLKNSYAEGGGGWIENASRLAHGIGVDTHKYIEGLLSIRH
ncbi:hypothetical protein F5Y16DRAFT_356239 [Xylariaceae sp. FL0255]|nr:hypothetical protein F5Y16DRAFT_356239 [Xylariaceae sp. FL0255]